MPWNQNLTNLRDWFADRYYTVEQSRRVVVEAGLKPRYIAFDDQAVVNWFNILTYAQNQQTVDEVIDVALIEYPNDRSYLLAAKAGILTGMDGVDIQTGVEWQGSDDPNTLEKVIGKRSSFLPIHFLEVGALKARSVVRIQLSDGSGSGFLTDGNLLITNHHVIASPEQAVDAIVQCNYQLTPSMLDADIEEYRLAPEDGFALLKQMIGPQFVFKATRTPHGALWTWPASIRRRTIGSTSSSTRKAAPNRSPSTTTRLSLSTKTASNI